MAITSDEAVKHSSAGSDPSAAAVSALSACGRSYGFLRLTLLMLPGYFGFLANLVPVSLPASILITRQTLSWEPNEQSLLADLDNGFTSQLAE